MRTGYKNISEDIKDWYALSCPISTLRFDKRTMELLDADKDGHIRVDEVLTAIEFMKAKDTPDAKDLSAEDAEKLSVYREHLDEFLANFVTMEALFEKGSMSAFQAGTLRIDEREMKLCFDVADEEAHSVLAGLSNCCVIYVKLTRPVDGATRNLCAVVTAGRISGLYVGRNGIFHDRDGGVWEAQVTKVIENQVSLVEAFFSPWRKLGELVAGAVRKFVETKKTESETKIQGLATVAATPAKPAAPAADGAGGAAMASGIAAIGIGLGMVGAAIASLMAAIKGMTPLQLAIAVVIAIAVVSLPNVILTWFKLRRRELGAILNASGWAINRSMRFSMRKAKEFTAKR